MYKITVCPYCGSQQIFARDDGSWYECADCEGQFVVINMNY